MRGIELSGARVSKRGVERATAGGNQALLNHVLRKGRKLAEKATPGGNQTMRPSVPLSRKPVTQGDPSKRPRPKSVEVQRLKKQATKRPKAKEVERAQLDFDPEGFIEVRVDLQHCQNIAEACGIPVQQLNSILQVDNSERVSQQQMNQIGEEIEREADQEDRVSDFDPDSDDDLSSGSD